MLEYDNRPCYIVSGDYVGKGTDGEPLIRNISIIKRLDNYRIKEFEKQGEQKPADNVEPKFHKGDWIIHQGTENIYQVVARIDNQYQLKYGDNYTTQYCEDIDKCTRLWDITKDAKDGDILVVERDKTPFIFKGFDKFHPECPIAYCGLDDNGIFIVNSGDGWWTNEKVEPATKEQCNFLFQKMKESGYEWDGEKKELKIIDWSKHIKYEPNGPSIIGQKQVIDYPDSLSKDNWELVHEFVEKFGRIPEDEDELNVLVEYVLKRQKSTWGEEDEKMFRNLHNLIYVVQDCDCDANEKKELSDWIESLKGRYQSKQEWSEEDESIMEAIVEGLKAMQSSFHFISSVKLDSAIDWLKSLRPQNNWKPSNEQIEALKDVREGVFRFGILESLYNDLKKLKGE